MHSMLRRSLLVLGVLAMVASACSPSGTTDSPGERGQEEPSTAVTSQPEQSGPAGVRGDEGELPLLPILSVSAPVVAPGDSFTVTADPRRTGSVEMQGDGTTIAEAALDGGSATLTVPSGTAPGVYTLTNDSDQGAAFGVIGVAGGPSLWLSASQWVSSDETEQVTVTSYGIPDDLTIALELTAPGQAPERLVPHPVAGLAPIPAHTDPGKGLARGRTTVTLPAGFTGSVRAVADTANRLDVYADTEEEPAYASSEVRIRRCDEPTGITGNLGEKGSVAAFWVNGGPRSATAATDDGAFTLAVSPGPVMISAFVGLEPAAASPQIVQVKCGEVLDVGDMSETVDTGPAPGTYLGGMALDEAWAFTATASGDITFSHEGVTECSVSGSDVELQFAGPGSDTHLYYVTIPDFSGTGRYEASFRIIDVLEDGESTGTAQVVIEQGRIEGIDVVGGEFTAAYEGALGSGTVEGRFTCGFVTALDTAYPIARGTATTGGAFAAPLLAGGAGTSGRACRKAFVVGAGSYPSIDGVVMYYTAQTFNNRLPRVASLTMNEAAMLLDQKARQMLLGTPEEDQIDIDALAGAVAADYLIWMSVARVGETWLLEVTAYDYEHDRLFFRQQYSSDTEEGLLGFRVGDELAGTLQKVGICGDVDQKEVQVGSGEQEEVTYRLTDLAGQAAEAAIDAVASTCGTFEPKSGDTANGEFTTTFTGGDGGCTDQVTFVARADSPVGEVTTEKDKDESTTSIAIPTFSYRYVITYGGTTSVEGSNMPSYSSGSAFVRAESEGEFFVDTDLGATLGTSPLIGAGRGRVVGGDPAAPCALISPSGVDVHPQEWKFDGDYQVLVSGELVTGSPDGGGTLKLNPGGYRLVVTGSWSDPDCFPPGEMTNEIFSYISSAVFVLNPAILVEEATPDGYLMEFTADGSKTKKSWPITVGGTAGSGTITIELWQSDSGTG